MPRLSPSASRSAWPRVDADVLDGVVRVDVEVAAGPQREVEPAVVGEEHEHVVEEPDAGVDVGDSLAVEVQRDGDVGLVGRALDLCAALAEWCSSGPASIVCLRRLFMSAPH